MNRLFFSVILGVFGLVGTLELADAKKRELEAFCRSLRGGTPVYAARTVAERRGFKVEIRSQTEVAIRSSGFNLEPHRCRIFINPNRAVGFWNFELN